MHRMMCCREFAREIDKQITIVIYFNSLGREYAADRVGV